MLDKGADVNAMDKEKESAISWAASGNHSVNIMQGDGRTAVVVLIL